MREEDNGMEVCRGKENFGGTGDATELNTQAIEKLIYRTRIGLAPKVTGSVIYKVQATWRRFYC